MPGELRAVARAALLLTDPAEKLACVQALNAAATPVDVARVQPPVLAPGRPARPVLVPPSRVPRRGTGTAAGRAALLHAIAHIEFNAINLALDAVARFADLPEAYYRDWWRVAVEEARHFALLKAHLATLAHAYGDFPAHDGLWEAARKTADDCLARMALVPRILEARGLDVTPGLRARLIAAGDAKAAAILEVILREEIGHVAIGNRWFHHLCAERGVDPAASFRALCARYGQTPPRPPFNVEARLAGGFTREELAEFGAGPTHTTS
ncbi:MAG TPA: ferritin-like domain-containing protein [Gammaproteobacteria bacterium]|nr:ferritin-like domain-containing protein [Gammaproteobacteria bacterium]